LVLLADLEVLDLFQHLLGCFDGVNILIDIRLVYLFSGLLVGILTLIWDLGLVKDIHSVENGMAKFLNKDFIVEQVLGAFRYDGNPDELIDVRAASVVDCKHRFDKFLHFW